MLALTLNVAVKADETSLNGIVTKVRDGDTIEVGKIPIRLTKPLGPLIVTPRF